MDDAELLNAGAIVTEKPTRPSVSSTPLQIDFACPTVGNIHTGCGLSNAVYIYIQIFVIPFMNLTLAVQVLHVVIHRIGHKQF